VAAKSTKSVKQNKDHRITLQINIKKKDLNILLPHTKIVKINIKKEDTINTITQSMMETSMINMIEMTNMMRRTKENMEIIAIIKVMIKSMVKDMLMLVLIQNLKNKTTHHSKNYFSLVSIIL
jgi:hypothetical protein